MSQRELSKTLGVSLGKVNYCMRGLIKKGLVKAENYRNSSNKTAYLYMLTPSGLVTKGNLARRYLQRRMEEYDRLVSEIEQLRQEATTVEAAVE